MLLPKQYVIYQTISEEKLQNKDLITASPINESHRFYSKKCFFNKKSKYGISLPLSNFQKLRDNNKTHTKSEIQLVIN